MIARNNVKNTIDEICKKRGRFKEKANEKKGCS